MVQTVLLHKPEEVTLDVHQVMPSLKPEEFEALREDIRINSILTPILLDSDYNVIDGHNRIHCWKQLLKEGENIGAVAAVVHPPMGKWEAFDLAMSVNTARRQLTHDQKKDLARDLLCRLAHRYEGEGFVKEGERRSWDNTRIARLIGIGKQSVRGIRQELEDSATIPVADKFVSYMAAKGVVDKPHERTLDRWEHQRRAAIATESNRVNPEDTPVNTEYTGEPDEVADLIESFTDLVTSGNNGALQQLAEAGFHIPGAPRGKTREEKVYSILASFRDQLKANPSDPKAVARAIADQPMQVAATVEDFGELNRWLTVFHAELVNIMEKVEIHAS